MQALIKADEMRRLLGQAPKFSSWVEITQAKVDQFADVTNDHQFIHVDPEKAAESLFGGTIAHGFLLLSLLPSLLREQVKLPQGLALCVNYGLDKVRFLQPVRVGSRVRASQRIIAVEEKKAGTWKINTEVMLEVQGDDAPVMAAELITLLVSAGNDAAGQGK